MATTLLRDSFASFGQAVAAMIPERLDSAVGPPARNLPGFEWSWTYSAHTAHHRGQPEVYLRAKVIKPPGNTF